MAKYFYRYSCQWEDAVSKCEWESLDTAIHTVPKLCYTNAYLIEKNKNCLLFSMTFQGQEGGEIMCIPLKSVKKLIKHKDSKFILKDMPYGTF